jgi:hypothetical protein
MLDQFDSEEKFLLLNNKEMFKRKVLGKRARAETNPA